MDICRAVALSARSMDVDSTELRDIAERLADDMPRGRTFAARPSRALGLEHGGSREAQNRPARPGRVARPQAGARIETGRAAAASEADAEGDDPFENLIEPPHVRHGDRANVRVIELSRATLARTIDLLR